MSALLVQVFRPLMRQPAVVRSAGVIRQQAELAKLLQQAGGHSSRSSKSLNSSGREMPGHHPVDRIKGGPLLGRLAKIDHLRVIRGRVVMSGLAARRKWTRRPALVQRELRHQDRHP